MARDPEGSGANGTPRFIELKREKLGRLREEEAVTTDPERKFELEKRIETLEAELADFSGQGAGRLDHHHRPEEVEPIPSFTDQTSRRLAKELEHAYLEYEALTSAGQDASAALDEILSIKRRIRAGGRLKPGDILQSGRFRLLERLGRGGFASVFKAYDRHSRQLVAIKVLHGQYADDRSRRERFFRGARKMTELQHQGIVRVIEPKLEDEGYHYFVMEYVNGGDLRQAVLGGQVSELEILRQVAEALDFAHQLGIVHRDVKPANILLTEDGCAKLTDFDLVRALDTTGGTRTGSMLGTFLYMAPEAMHAAKDVGPAADVYSLAMTAAFILYGQEIPLTMLRDPRSFFSRLKAPKALREVLEGAASWEPRERPSTALELLEGLLENRRDTREKSDQAPTSTGPIVISSPSPTNLDKDLFLSIETKDGLVDLWREIPAGSFLMGSTEKERASYRSERPQHQVVVRSPFRIAAVPTTVAQYAAFDPNHRSFHHDKVPPDRLAQHPVEDVSWRKAVEFCEWLSNRFSWARGARLPTETEWEYACRAGSQTRYWSGDEESDLDAVGWYDENSDDRTHRVGLKAASPWGLYDVHGNVLEWTASRWSANYSGREDSMEVDPSAIDRPAAEAGGVRVFRSGSYFLSARDARSAFRYGFLPELALTILGFRVLLPSPHSFRISK